MAAVDACEVEAELPVRGCEFFGEGGGEAELLGGARARWNPSCSFSVRTSDSSRMSQEGHQVPG
ncbi:hypothetical protein [Streptomyces xiaopingdaonensis]|uniref:hypothetical protein n=1 Tax=Streptomyces xiaopingdaonensis TaxID=1565415 RepID=UPI00031EE793|nr:hypothetical protein [Streptomyces xiaopingdaonensis]